MHDFEMNCTLPWTSRQITPLLDSLSLVRTSLENQAQQALFVGWFGEVLSASYDLMSSMLFWSVSVLHYVFVLFVCAFTLFVLVFLLRLWSKFQ